LVDRGELMDGGELVEIAVDSGEQIAGGEIAGGEIAGGDSW
jgi:hypothetical protein